LDRWFEKLIDASVIASNELALKSALHKLTRELGFDCYAYLNLRPNETYAISTYPPEWQARYFSRFYANVDPVITMAKRKMRAFSWTENQNRNLDKEARRFYSEARDFGISIRDFDPGPSRVRECRNTDVGLEQAGTLFRRRHRSRRRGRICCPAPHEV